MTRALTIDELATVIRQHSTEFSLVAQQKVITVDSLAYAVSKLAVDPEVARSLVATASGVERDKVAAGFGCFLQAAVIAAATLQAHPHVNIATLFYQAVAPGFGSETGSVQ